VFDALKKGFREAQNRLAGLTELDQRSVQSALKEVRVSLLEADVELGVVKRFLARVEEKAIGQTVQTTVKHAGEKLKVSASDQFVKICHDELIAMMSHEGDAEPLRFADKGRTGILMVGLQGSGKTTTCAKLARLLAKNGHSPLLVAADMQRPAAVEQLKVLGDQIDVPVWSVAGASPLDICRAADAEAKRLGCDVIVYDTAGRLAIDEPLMAELGDIRTAVEPENILLVIDAMIGQDAVRTAAAFNQRLTLTGVVLTKLDGDARGGAALSVKEVTGAPVLFAGVGEGTDKLEEFRPEGMAGRILGMGDVVGLMKDFEGVVDEKKAEQDAKKMLRGQFSLDEFLGQLEMLQGMGPLQDMLEKLPFFGDSVPEGFQVDEREIDRTKAIVRSMTRAERNDVVLFTKQPKRVQRVAKGSGRTDHEVGELLQKFTMMKQIMGSIGQQAGMLSRIPGMKQLANMSKLRDAVRTGGLEGNPMMANLADQLLEAAVAGQGGQRGASAKKPVDKNKKKKQRQEQKKARRKGRK
jgi:signal recognition particle subunit SRP54